MAYRNRLGDDVRRFWGEKGLRASHEKKIAESQVEMMEEREIGAWREEGLQGSLQGEKYRWERTRASRPVDTTISIFGHITALLGAGVPRTHVWLCRSHSWY